jgi:hypothetical protein
MDSTPTNPFVKLVREQMFDVSEFETSRSWGIPREQMETVRRSHRRNCDGTARRAWASVTRCRTRNTQSRDLVRTQT